MAVINVLIIVLAILVGLYYYISKRKETYWINKGLEIFNIYSFHLPELSCKIYDHFKKRGLKYGVARLLNNYVFVTTDLDLLKNILQKEFDSFRNHGKPIDEKLDPLKAHIVFLTDDRWKNLRAKLTPTFTTGKMKMMFNTMTECAQEMLKVVEEAAKIQDVIEIKDLMARYTTDIIGSCAFGIDCNSIKNMDSELRKYTIDKKKSWRYYANRLLTPSIKKFIRFKDIDPDEELFFINLVKNMIDHREKNNIYRKDFFHLMLQLKNRGRVVDDEQIMDNNKPGNYMSLLDVTAQCYVFFTAGFDTSSSLMAFAFFELAQNQEIQDTLRREIKSVLETTKGELTYDAIMKMNYLDQVVNEALRLYPPAALTGRTCNRSYQIPGTEIVLEPGDDVLILIMGIHRDPDIYPDPEKFDPDRFTPENRAKRHPCSFLPFGDGPRQCIGLRFGILQSKVGIASILNEYKLTVNQRTKLPIVLNSQRFLTSVEGGVWLNATKLDK